jgi:hypothetical protein
MIKDKHFQPEKYEATTEAFGARTHNSEKISEFFLFYVH